MKKKVIVKGPALSASGYGEHARFVLRSLKDREDEYEIYLHNLNWGKTGWLFEDNEESGSTTYSRRRQIISKKQMVSQILIFPYRSRSQMSSKKSPKLTLELPQESRRQKSHRSGFKNPMKWIKLL